MKIALLVKKNSKEIKDKVILVINELLKNDFHISMLEENIIFLSLDNYQIKSYSDKGQLLESCDIVIAVGGDGTIFHAAASAMKYKKAILGINAGKLGFLAQLEIENISKLSYLKENKYHIENRLVLQAEYVPKNGNKKEFYAINDIVFSRPGYGQIFDIQVFCGKDEVGIYKSDGLIFSTPTGSTAYNLSAGGPISNPTTDCIIMSPIASHSLISRSIVFSGNNILKAIPVGDIKSKSYLICDGEMDAEISVDDYVIISKAPFSSRFVCLDDYNFYYTLIEKMKGRG